MPAAAPLFNPKVHLAYQKRKAILTMKDIKLDPSPISQVASTDPFQLLSNEGVKAFRRELFSKNVLENCSFPTRPGSVQLRGMAPRYAPFTYQFWTSLEVLGIIRDLAGVDLVPVFDHEIAHTNIQLGPHGLDGVKDTPSKKETSKPVVPWHRDSYPFVCVVMLSDTTSMIDGETEMAKGDGSTVKVRSPTMGGAVIMQGRHVSHIAIPAGNMPERITLVTSFRPRDPIIVDDSSLMNVRTKSLLPEIYYQWVSYRLRLLGERFKDEADKLNARYTDAVALTDEAKPGFCRKETVDFDGLTNWMDEQMRYMRQTLFEMRPVTDEDNINKNYIPRID
ncbi:hypothetical protein N7478_004722 [Penicillium angulare]|uniref:uncharacterized protein n=1 Tax=Penicillium angulare TaxID=116970 RepID=UPI0025408741|nr:uncharacterized protein N7478_004722 [Penicillium angulare]KAJ5279350.1 hypothetical protein N7478_004722 [Penicillium angulare]